MINVRVAFLGRCKMKCAGVDFGLVIKMLSAFHTVMCQCSGGDGNLNRKIISLCRV